MADDGQAYARITAMLGNGRVRAVVVPGGQERLCRIRGSMRRREWVRVGDVVLVCEREGLAGDVADLVYRYDPREVAKLVAWGELVDAAAPDADEDLIVFQDVDDV